MLMLNICTHTRVAHSQPCIACHSTGFVVGLPAKESFGGMRLLRRADFNAGANVNTFWRMPCRGSQDVASKKTLTWDNKQITWFGMWLWLFLSLALSPQADSLWLSLAPSLSGWPARSDQTQTFDPKKKVVCVEECPPS